MGYERYSDDAASARVIARVASGRPAVASYTADVSSGKAPRKVHPNLDPRGMKFRESRDSANHPEAVPVVIALDETGSMGSVVKQIQRSIRSIMALLVSKGYLPHPHVMVVGVGDYPNGEKASLQVSQFESDDKIEQCVDDLLIEGQGGGTKRESYQNAAWVVAYKTRTDHWEKRGRRGYFFIFGDEMNHAPHAAELVALIGTSDEASLQTDPSLKTIYDRVLERYHTFFVLPRNAANGNDEEVVGHWKSLLGPENVLRLEDEDAAGELVAAQIGLVEGRVDVSGVARDVADVHGPGVKTEALVRAVTRSVTTAYGGTTGVAKVSDGALSSSVPVNVKRL